VRANATKGTYCPFSPAFSVRSVAEKSENRMATQIPSKRAASEVNCITKPLINPLKAPIIRSIAMIMSKVVMATI